ncbi:hypothetical protein [Actinoplanes sp. NPDC049802]|uniref:hypothetical protein n=1 Tax=Actinoplanes sp. NPDC049802 TaxID=3154742 RepID=UPI003405A421
MCAPAVWNKTLADRRAAFSQRGEKTSYQQTDAALTGWKKTAELAFLSEVSPVPLQQTLRHQHTAFGSCSSPATNILAAGRAVAGDNPGEACGADVRQQGSSLLRSAV